MGAISGRCSSDKKAWDKVPADAREAMLKIAMEAGQQVKKAGRAESDAAVAAMVKRGLIVQKLTPEVDAEWVAVIDNYGIYIRGKIVPADMFDEAQRVLKEYRSAGGGKSK